MVTVFRSADKNAGVQAADAIRTRISQDVSVKQLWVLPKQDITSNLEASGFPTNEALNMNDARQLAQLLRGDVFLVGNVVRDSAGYRVDAQYVLTRDQSLVQPLGSFRVGKPDQAAGAVSKAFQDAQKAFIAERNCVNKARDGKYAEAIAEARKGIAAYPNSTLNRICLANIMVTQKASPDSILAVVNEVLRIDPRSKPALTVAYQSLKDAGKNAEATDMLLRLVGADPANSRLVEQVINEFAASGQAAKAIPFVDQLVRDNPGDPNYLSLQMRVHLAAKDYKGGIAAGEELLKADTAQATADVFTRLAAAAAVDSQPQKASQLMAQAVAKFPTNIELLTNYADILRTAGQNQQALDVLNKVAQSNPQAKGINISRARIFSEMNQPDSALAALKSALTAGDSASTVALYAVSVGQNVFKAAQASKAIADFQRAVPFFEFANTTSATPEGQFLLGATQFSIGATLLQDINKLARGSAAEKRQGCDMSKTAQAAFTQAQINLPAGGKFNPTATQQMLAQLAQYSPYADQFAKALCK
ncbi:tetratricopeptide repeat protein [Gemmatirosa kalamazoonensis]|uniref:tetratricopeptide repeat protein n=1 Tax=Gemmatirosa kalamazoonensis TaxID=861299 RepID=UPI00046D7DC6|nr:tetratricopeptide repeat protein [Gemmatirosa kalamazoonensis]